MIQYYIVFDIETPSLPLDWDAPVEEIDNWPGLLEIAWQIYNDDRELVSENSLIVRPENGRLSEEIEKLTGISTDYANEHGVSTRTALTELASVLQTFNPVLVAHNCEFDTKVLDANFIKNGMEVRLNAYRHVCTMKESTQFCNLPKLKHPKLSELYEILFSEIPNVSHRALPDVQATAKAFFKLQDIDVISLKNPSPLTPSALEKLTTGQVEKAIAAYIFDLNNFPLFYDLNNISNLSDDRMVDEVKGRFNKYYQTAKGKTFEIPYDQVANRTVIALNIEDTLIRYVLTNHLRSQTNFISSTEKYNDQAIRNLCQKEIEKGNSISIKVDINNCYESISHNKLIKEVSRELQLNENSTYLIILANALQVIYETASSEVVKKQIGLLIGSKPDEYLAEFFLDKVEAGIKQKGISIIRVADEFIFFADTFLAAREIFKSIQEVASDFGLLLNKSKTIINDYRQGVLNEQLNLELVNVGASVPLLSYRVSKSEATKNSKSNLAPDNYSAHEINNDIEIQSYDSAILFLKQMLRSQKDIGEYQKKHPDYKYLYNIVYSQPTDFIRDFFNLDKSVFSKANVERLRKVIYYYPKSEYYTALAIQLLTFAATNTVHVTDRFRLNKFEEDTFTSKYYYLHQTCELANLTILELLQSTEIHEYQKYILLRCLFKKHDALDLDLESYNVNAIHFHFFDDLELNETLPFKNQVLQEVASIGAATKYYPLKMICSELEKLKNTDIDNR